MKDKKFGILFEPKGYNDDFLESIKCENQYFVLTDSDNCIECGDIFSTVDSFEYATIFPKKQFSNKEYEYLYNKLFFLNDIIKIIFSDIYTLSVEVYISNQYSTTIDDYNEVTNVVDGKLTEAIIKSYEPVKGNNYYGLKTIKFFVCK